MEKVSWKQMVEAYFEEGCPFCLKMQILVALKNAELNPEDQIEMIWEDSGDARIGLLIDTYDREVLFPTLIKVDVENEIIESTTGVAGSFMDGLNLNKTDNFLNLDYLLSKD